MSSNMIFDDIIEVLGVDEDQPKVFEKVSRIRAKTEDAGCEIKMDINSEIYQMKKNEKYTMRITKNLTEGSSADVGHFDYNLYTNENSLMKKYDYIMYGKVFKCTPENNDNISIFISRF